MLVPPHTLALPAVNSLEDCSNFTIAVQPFIPQLYDFPQRFFQSLSDPEALKNVYLSTNPLISGFALSLFLAPIFLVVSEFNKNYSQVDRVWSILPTIYNAHYALWAYLAGIPNERTNTILAFSCIWSARLTFNYWRRGGYTIGSEDYRWEVVRQGLHPALMFLLNLTFISLIQSVLLFSVTMPTYLLMLSSYLAGQREMATSDLIFSRVLVGLVLLEFFADQQQWNYQHAKKQYQSTAKVPARYSREDLDRGFVASGLWAFSRHPNFLAEQTIWFTLYQWGCYETDNFWNWTVAGAVSYLALFQASTVLTESITANKYADYKEYQRKVGKFLPTLTGLMSGGFHGGRKTGEISGPGGSAKASEKESSAGKK